MRVLVTGGSGYLGQFLIQALADKKHNVVYVWATRELPGLPVGVTGVRADLATGDGLQEAMKQGPFHAVINCAALAAPAACFQDPEAARALNVPARLLAALSTQWSCSSASLRPLLIQLSTDQVYDGSHANWREDEKTLPVNDYARTKLEAEEAIRAAWSKHAVCLRSSLIYGPQPPYLPVPRGLFIQFLPPYGAGSMHLRPIHFWLKEQALTSGKATTFFTDEWRCPVYVKDICAICLRLCQRHADLVQAGRAELPDFQVLNMGGPNRLSRADMAAEVARTLGLPADATLITPISVLDIERPFASPQDISMTSSKLEQQLGIQLTPFREGLAQIFPPKSAPHV